MKITITLYILTVVIFLAFCSGCRSGKADAGNETSIAGVTDAAQTANAPTPNKSSNTSVSANQGNLNAAETKQKESLPVAKSPGISVCAEGLGGNGLEIKDADFAHMQTAHAEVLKRWLCFRKVNMRPTREEKDSLSSQEYFKRDNPKSDPFYAIGDFNKNGVQDFAVILDFFAPKISPEKRELNAMAIFEMSPPKTGDKPVEAFFSDEIDSLFIIGVNKDYGLWLASYPSDDGVIFAPKGDKYVVKAMVE